MRPCARRSVKAAGSPADLKAPHACKPAQVCQPPPSRLRSRPNQGWPTRSVGAPLWVAGARRRSAFFYQGCGSMSQKPCSTQKLNAPVTRCGPWLWAQSFVGGVLNCETNSSRPSSKKPSSTRWPASQSALDWEALLLEFLSNEDDVVRPYYGRSFDYSKAFDSCSGNLAIDILRRWGLPPNVVQHV